MLFKQGKQNKKYYSQTLSEDRKNIFNIDTNFLLQQKKFLSPEQNEQNKITTKIPFKYSKLSSKGGYNTLFYLQ